MGNGIETLLMVAGLTSVSRRNCRRPPKTVTPRDTTGPPARSSSVTCWSRCCASANGDFGARMPSGLDGLEGKIADAFNDILAVSSRRTLETARVCRVVGKEGKLKERMRVPSAGGGWADEIIALNTLIDDLVWPTTEVTRAVGAVAKGDLSQAMALDVDGRPLEGEFLRSAKLVNSMIDQLSVFASEVTRVAREVGTEGKLGGQAQVKGVSGVWKDLTESVNQMAGNLTAQVRNIADVTIAVASGDLSKKITVDVRGEIPPAQGGEQRHGRSAPRVRVGGDARGARGRHGRQARRPGGRAGCRRDLGISPTTSTRWRPTSPGRFATSRR